MRSRCMFPVPDDRDRACCRPDPDRRPRRPTGSYGGAVVMVLCLVATSVAQHPPTPVQVVEARSHQAPRALTLVGSVLPYTRSVIASELAGLVESMPVDEGDLVQKEQVLVKLQDTIHVLAKQEAEARLEQLQAELDELEAGTRPEEIAQAKATFEEIKAVLEKWNLELDRVKRLRGQSSASEKEYNDTVAEQSAGQQRLRGAEAAYDLALAGPRKEVIARARFAVAAQQAVLDRLEYDLAQTEIRAPFKGYVTRQLTEVGEWITAGGAVIELIDLERVLVRVNVPESAISGSEVGDSVSVDVDALSRTFTGRIKHIIPQADVRARTFPVEVELSNESHALKSGMFVRARVTNKEVLEDTLIVPRDAILQRQGTHYVVVVSPSPMNANEMQAAPFPVELGADVGAWIAIRSPMVQPGTQVAIKGHDRVYGPEPVMVAPGGEVPPPATQSAGALTAVPGGRADVSVDNGSMTKPRSE